MPDGQPPPGSSQKGPIIPDKYVDVPSQRLYYLSFGLICQAAKALDFIRSFASQDLTLCRKWLLIDFLYCAVLSKLRIPRLDYSLSVVILQIVSLWFFDGLLFGGINLNVAGVGLFGPAAGRTVESSRFGFLSPLTFGLLEYSEDTTSDSHLQGQHTIRMSPISTAQLNPNHLSFCLAPPENSVLIPVLLNNTAPTSLRYSIIPLGATDKNAERHELSTKEIRAIEQARLDALQLVRSPAAANEEADEYDEYDDDEDDDSSKSQSNLQTTQSLVHVRISKPGRIRLERVVDSSSADARILYSPEVVVAPCPRVEFASKEVDETRCIGQDPDVDLLLDIRGIPPLSLRWYKTINGRWENYLVEGIQGNRDEDSPLTRRGMPQKLQIPLTISLDKVGSHTYGLEEIVDAVGNIVRVDPTKTELSKVSRSFQVLRRPSVSFRQCGPGNPSPMLIGSEAPLSIAAHELDSLDAPLDITVKYQPPKSDDKADKKHKPWTKTFSTQENRRDLTVHANTPGEYSIASVKGKHCVGDVLVPETCEVYERPLPTAEFEWKKIHECSGDTGVSASLVLYGTPPFQVYYRIQRDKEPPRDLAKTFASSRGELTLQPERSGQYRFSFLQISDAHYSRVDLNGPSIDQVIHPLASAAFVASSGGSGGRKTISSCEGNTVKVDVDLKGTGPWNLEVQVVGPKNSDIIVVKDIETWQKTLEIPIPQRIDKEGGAFEIDLISVEDNYKCKRSLSVPGMRVNVRRFKPTAKFYGEDSKRHMSVLEHEQASLPLRLTGDGPWRIKYRRKEAEAKISTATLRQPNDYLLVNDKGLYEITEVRDSQCPGTVFEEASTYEVKWIPRPSAKLSERTVATYEPFNGSYILPPICEGISDHVDLDLSGRPPFEIMYNIAQNTEYGGTKLLNQPTFNSIQERTRFQLQTSSPGRVYYEVKQIGDAAYPLAKHKNAVIPRSQRLLFEQQVNVRPTARFKTNSRLSYCVNDAFTDAAWDSVVVLEGLPPFMLTLAIKNLVNSHVEIKTVTVPGHEWKIDLPDYKFKSAGAHRITIRGVSDASSCEQGLLDPLETTISVDVAETAAIVPFERREHYCIGDLAQFQLEGKPPWTISYKANGKAYTQEAKTSPFALVQQHAGNFEITSIAHQQKKCQAEVKDLKFNVHPLPSAKIGHGKRVYQDLHEGDQAEIVFSLIGTPPFTFTYQRSEPSPKKGGKSGKVLETYTVSHVAETEYSIFSALEGTWTVTSISDKYCRYPPHPESEKRET